MILGNSKPYIRPPYISPCMVICSYSTDTVKNYYASRKRFIEIEKTHQQTLEKIVNKLKNSNIANLLNLDENADPNLKYTTIILFINKWHHTLF